jgi:DNA polymerase III sliding clamp (beta) subunit (PCNA family)
LNKKLNKKPVVEPEDFEVTLPIKALGEILRILSKTTGDGHVDLNFAQNQVVLQQANENNQYRSTQKLTARNFGWVVSCVPTTIPASF